jgi:serine/threonine protein phosphatase PrpC
MSLTTNIDNIYKNGVIGNVRKAQEDSHDMKLKTPNGDVFVVCDGMGGHVGGAKASSLAVESILSFLNKEKYNNPIEALDGALQFANTQIIGFANEHPEFKGMGTTACILLFQGDEAWIAHVGDSRIYLYLGKEKELHRITKDHSYVQMLVDKGQLDEEQAETDPNKNRILKALGVTTNLQPTFNYQNKPILPKNDDIFLICSDGLSGMIPDKTIKEILSEKELSIEQKGDELIRRAMEGETVQPGGQDNCTVELIKVDNSPWKESEFKSYNPGKKKFSITGNFGSKQKGLSSKLIAAILVVLLVVMGVLGWWIISQIQTKRLVENLTIQRVEAEKQMKDLEKDTTATYNQLNKAKEKLDDFQRIQKELDDYTSYKKPIEDQTNAVNTLQKLHEQKVDEFFAKKELVEKLTDSIEKLK